MKLVDPMSNSSVKQTSMFINDSQRELMSLVNMVILGGAISLFGSVANVINLIVFYRQGLDTTINISFFSLAVSDLCSLLFQQLFNLYINPAITNLNLPIVYLHFQYVTTGAAREMFARITCLITAFITAERCLCVVFPLEVNRIVTPKRTTIVIAVIYIFTAISIIPFYGTKYFAWKFYSESNRTLLGLACTQNNYIVETVVFLAHGLFTMLAFISALIFTLILIYHLKQKSAWRQTARIDEEKAKLASKRDTATITLVVLIAGILVLCYAPSVLLSITIFLEREFSFGPTEYYNLCYSLWTFALLFENVNSSVNIFFYYQMSSKYRRTFRKQFCFGSKLSTLIFEPRS